MGSHRKFKISRRKKKQKAKINIVTTKDAQVKDQTIYAVNFTRPQPNYQYHISDDLTYCLYRKKKLTKQQIKNWEKMFGIKINEIKEMKR